MKQTLASRVTWLENGIVVISGPALAVSGIVAGVDLLTGGHLLAGFNWLVTLIWAVTLMLTLDFTVLILGVQARRVVATEKNGWALVGKVALAVAIAGAISFVSIQMQSIIARVNAEAIPIDQAAGQLGISMIQLTWERSCLVLFLIFMSGWLRQDKTDGEGTVAAVASPESKPVTVVEAPVEPAPLQLAAPPEPEKRQKTQVYLKLHPGATDKELATYLGIERPAAARYWRLLGETDGLTSPADLSANRKEISEPIYMPQYASKEQAIMAALQANPRASDQELAEIANTTPRTAGKWAAKHRKEEA